MSDEIQREKDEVLKQYSELQQAVTLSDLLETITDTTTAVTELPARIKALRDRGYAFAGYLEGKADILAKQWEAIANDARRVARQKTTDLTNDLNEIEDKATNLTNAQGIAAKTYINQVEPVIKRIKSDVEAATKQIQSTCGEIPNNVQQTKTQIESIETYLQLAEEASFKLNAAECVFMAVEAEWEDHKDKPDGIFFITDQRVIMEQKEKTGKMLGMFGGKMQHQVLWEAPIGSIDEVSHENKGLFGGVDLIHLKMGAGSQFAKLSLEVKGGIKAEWFAAQLKRASTGGLEKERGLKVDEALIDAIANAPTICPVCGATFDDPIVAGMTQIKCKYCGGVTRLAL